MNSIGKLHRIYQLSYIAHDKNPGGYLTREVMGMCGKFIHTLYPVTQKMPQMYTLLHKTFAKVHCFTRTLKNVLLHDNLSHNLH